MHAQSKKDIRHLGLRVSPALLGRITEAAWRLKMSVQAFCIEALEARVSKLERKNGNGDPIPAKSVREKLPELKSQKDQSK